MQHSGLLVEHFNEVGWRGDLALERDSLAAFFRSLFDHGNLIDELDR